MHLVSAQWFYRVSWVAMAVLAMKCKTSQEVGNQ